MFAVTEINDVEKLAGYRLLWRNLWGKTRNANVFQTNEWLEHYMWHYGKKQRLRVLLVTVAGRPIGIVPLVVKRVESRLGIVRVLTYPLDSWGHAFGPIGPNPAATMLACVRHLNESRRDWDLLDLRYVDHESSDRGRTENALRSAGLSFNSQAWRNHSVVAMDASWEDYWCDRSELLQKAVAHARASLAKNGSVTFERYRPEGAHSGDTNRRWDLMCAFERVWRQNARQSAEGDATSAAIEFLRSTHESAVDLGAADLCLLRSAGNPVAAAYSYCVDGRVELVRLAVDPAVDREVAHVLLARMLEDGFARGDSRFVSTSRDHAIFRMWRTSTLQTMRYTHFASLSPRAQLMRLNRRLQSHAPHQPRAARTTAAAAKPPRLTIVR